MTKKTVHAMLFIASALLLAIPAAAQTQQVYKWVDAKGVTHYSTSVPPDESRHDIKSIDTQTFSKKSVLDKPLTAEEKKAATAAEKAEKDKAKTKADNIRKLAILKDRFGSVEELKKFQREEIVITIQSKKEPLLIREAGIAAKIRELEAAAGSKIQVVEMKKEQELVTIEINKINVEIAEIKKKHQDEITFWQESDSGK